MISFGVAKGRHSQGGQGDDKLLGDAGNDRLIGDGGSDILRGDEGKDILRGGQGDDKLFGGAGNDRLIGDEGDDVLMGGVGNDVFLYNEGDGSDIIDGGKGRDVLILKEFTQTFELQDANGEIVEIRDLVNDDQIDLKALGGEGKITSPNGFVIDFKNLESLKFQNGLLDITNTGSTANVTTPDGLSFNVVSKDGTVVSSDNTPEQPAEPGQVQITESSSQDDAAASEPSIPEVSELVTVYEKPEGELDISLTELGFNQLFGNLTHTNFQNDFVNITKNTDGKLTSDFSEAQKIALQNETVNFTTAVGKLAGQEMILNWN